MSVPEVTVDELAAAHAAGELVVDVREPDEYAQAHVPGAVLMPLGSVPARHAELPRDQTVYVVCAVGARSMQAAQYLARLGYDVRNVDGGTNDWLAAGMPVESGSGSG
ncbi:MAG: rhodanese-like domain-containing protein [Actinomycetota bacterium]